MSLLLETQISADADTRKSEPGPVRPTEAAHIITSDAEAIEIAKRLAERFSTGASDRDHFRRWPAEELDLFSQSGLWSINVPKKFGGPELSYATVAKVTAIISGADPSLGQLPQNHLGGSRAVQRRVQNEPDRHPRADRPTSRASQIHRSESYSDRVLALPGRGRVFWPPGAAASPGYRTKTRPRPGRLSYLLFLLISTNSLATCPTFF
jgi:hypothetical protein